MAAQCLLSCTLSRCRKWCTEPKNCPLKDRFSAAWPRHHHPFRGSFSAGSTPIFASRYAFFSGFQSLQKKSSSRKQSLQISSNNLLKNRQNFTEFLSKICISFCELSEMSTKLQNFVDFLQNFAKSCRLRWHYA